MAKVKRRTPRDEVVREEVDRDSLGLDTDDDVTFASVTTTGDVSAGNDVDVGGNLTGVTDLTLETLNATSTTGADLSSTGHALQIGADANQNTAWDPGEVQSRNNGAAAAYEINRNGGILKVNSATEGGIEVGAAAGVATVKAILTGSTTWDPPDISAASSASTTFTVTGAAVNDPVAVSPSTDANTQQWFAWWVWVSSANTVTVKLVPTFSAGSVNPGSGTWTVVVFHL